MADRATNQDWLDLVQEEALEPDLPIIDPHHHLWDFKTSRVNPRYFLEEMLEDTNSGHNIVATVFIECGAMFREDGPEAARALGETLGVQRAPRTYHAPYSRASTPRTQSTPRHDPSP